MSRIANDGAFPSAGARYKDFPPGWGHLKIPVSSRAAALAGLALYAPCKRRGILAQKAAWVGVRLLGPAVLPGRSKTWRPPLEAEQWNVLLTKIQAVTGTFDAVAGYQRLQATRPGFGLLLLRDGGPVAFVKLRQGPDESFALEAGAHADVWRFAPRSFSVPEPLGVDHCCDWHFFAARALPPGLHRPADDPPLSVIVGEISEALGRLPPAADTPSHWRPMHGDFTPWNLRSLGGPLWLIDWEEAAWGPPGADEVLYRASSAALQGRSSDFAASLETLQFWEQQADRLTTNKRDHQFRHALNQVLRGMRAHATDR